MSQRNLQGVGVRYLFRCESADSLSLIGNFYDRSQGRLEGGVSWLTMGANGHAARFEELVADSPELPGAEAGSEPPAQGPTLLSYAEGAGRGGSFLEFAHGQLGAFGYAVPLPSSEPEEELRARARWAADCSTWRSS